MVLTKDSCILQLKSVTKDYAGIRALDNLNFDLRAGEVHALFGENGAGKSTTIAIIAGAITPTSGNIFLDNKEVNLNSVHLARNFGVSAVFQEFSLVENMSVAENIFLGSEENTLGMVSKQTIHNNALRILKDLEFDINPKTKVAYLSRAEQQMVEIAKAFRDDNLRVLILDEPTASLTYKETKQLYKLIDEVKKQGLGIIYITHRIKEIIDIADRITILRDGKFIATVNQKETNEQELLKLMTGRVVGQVFPKIKQSLNGKIILEVKNLKNASNTVKDASITVKAGEIVGLAGLVGSGKSSVARSIFCLDKVLQGKVMFKGEDCTNFSTKAMLNRGLIYLPPNRKDEGLVMNRSAKENISLNALDMNIFSQYKLIKPQSEKKKIQQLAEQLFLSPNNIDLNPEQFSGGNQQKIMLLKALTITNMDMIIFDEPTVGVDVSTRSVIYSLIKKLCENGKAILLISSDLPEILSLSTKAYVFYGGFVQAQLAGDQINEESVLENFFEKGKKLYE